MPLEPTSPVKPLLVFGYGNLSRGDDALGPLLIEYIQQHLGPIPVLEILCDFQLQIEHALDLEKRELVLFVDASMADIEGYGFSALSAGRDDSYSTHAMSPSAVMSVYQSIKKQPPPPCFLLSIKGEQFELGTGLSPMAQANLAQACRFADKLLANPDYGNWNNLAQGRVSNENLT